MAIYHFDNGLIKDMEVTFPHPGEVVAKLRAADGASHEAIVDLRQRLADQSLTTLMDSENDKPVMLIRGLKNEKDLTKALHKAGIGAPKDKTLTEEDKKRTKLTFSEKVHDQSLWLSALFYDLGNAAFFASGYFRGKHNPDGKMTPNDKSEIKIGAAFALGDILMTFYGHKKGDEQLQAASNSLSQHLQNKGIKIPQGAALNPDTLHQSGAVREVNNWIRHHIIHIKSLTEMGGGLYTIHSGSKPDEYGRVNKDKIKAGYLITAGWLATLLLDKSHRPPLLEGDKDSSDKGIIDKVADNPRGWVARPLAMANNIYNLRGALHPKLGERHRAKLYAATTAYKHSVNPTPANKKEMERAYAKMGDYKWNVISACSFLVAHTLFGMSGSKRPEETKDDKEVMQDLVLVSANMLAGQPEHIRKSAVGETAEYISKQPHVALSKEQVEEAINEKINTLTKSGWVERTQGKESDTQLTV